MVANNHLNALLLADDLAIFSLSKKKTTRKVKLAKNIIFNKQKVQSKRSNFTKKQKLIGLINIIIYHSLLNRLGKDM